MTGGALIKALLGGVVELPDGVVDAQLFNDASALPPQAPRNLLHGVVREESNFLILLLLGKAKKPLNPETPLLAPLVSIGEAPILRIEGAH